VSAGSYGETPKPLVPFSVHVTLPPEAVQAVSHRPSAFDAKNDMPSLPDLHVQPADVLYAAHGSAAAALAPPGASAADAAAITASTAAPTVSRASVRTRPRVPEFLSTPMEPLLPKIEITGDPRRPRRRRRSSSGLGGGTGRR
jgi:hypothetical protein